MSHYEERLERDVESLRSRVHALSERVHVGLDHSVRALLTLDKQLASRTILGDLPINREVRSIDRACHAFVAQHLPSAGHLRLVSSILRLMVALERVGDYAVTISRETVQLSAPPPEAVAQDIEMMAARGRELFRQAMRSFDEQSADLARGTKGMAAQLGGTFGKVFSDLIRAAEEGTRPIQDLFALLVVFNRLERVHDQAKNICEETLFAAEGLTKEPKIYRVLFLDARNDRDSALAEVIARRTFPQSGRYASAGWDPGDAFVPGLAAFASEHGCEIQKEAPDRIVPIHEELASYHVIVALEPGAREHIPELPFHTVLLEWQAPAGEESLEDRYKRLAHEIRELVETLRGEDAS